MSEPQRKELGHIQRAAALVELRMRLGRALAVLPTALSVGFAVAAVTLAVRKAMPHLLTNRRAWEILVAVVVVDVIALIAAASRRLPPRAGTVALDKHHALDGRLTNALAFVEARGERTALMEVAIDDACAHAEKLDARRAAPIPVPHDLPGSLGAAAAFAAVAVLFVPAAPPPPAPQAKQIDAVQMSPDDVELFRDAAKELAKKDQSPEVQAAVEKFNQLVEDIANRRIDRTEAFRRMEQIDRELFKGQEADAKAFDEALKQTADELKKSDLAKPFADSLEKKDFEKAKKDLKELAKDLKSGKKKPDKAALDRLKKALERAAAKKKESLAALNEKRNEIREQLLHKKNQKKDNPDGGAPREEEEERLLRKKERELERLDRDAERQADAQRRLDRLDKELAKAAEDLMRDLGMSAEDLEQAAEDINRMQNEEMSDKEKEELRQRLQELREILRQQGQGGKQRMARMLKFGKRARGGGQGQKGQGEKGPGEKGDQPGDDGDDGEDGQGKDGQGKDGQGTMPGNGGQKVLVLQKGAGAGQGPGQGPGQMPGDSPGQAGQGPDGQGPPGKGIGTSHDPNLTGKRTDLKGETHDVQESGADTKQGPSTSQVILTAAERGFRGRGYKKVFTDYRTKAEEEISKDTVPDGYRFYVHRYFQHIRPRE